MARRFLHLDHRLVSRLVGRAAYGCSLLLVLGLLGFVAGCRRPADSARTDPAGLVATVDGQAISADAFRRFWEEQRMTTNSAVLRERVLEQLIRRSAFAAAARREGLDRDPEVQAEIDNLLARRLRADRLKPRLEAIRVPEEALRKDYEDHRGKRFLEPEAVRVAVLWMNTRGHQPLEERYRPRLESIRSRLLADPAWISLSQGFGGLAITNSEHRVTRFKGGDTGWIRTGSETDTWVSEVARIANPLRQPGELSEVVSGPGGMFLVRLMERRAAQTMAFETVKAEIQRRLLSEQRQAVEATFERELLASARIERFPDSLHTLTNLDLLPADTSSVSSPASGVPQSPQSVHRP